MTAPSGRPVVVVTGAAGLIGRSLVQRFAAGGALVVGTDIAAEAGDLPAGDHVHVRADLATAAGRQAVFDRAVALGGPTVVVHNAAITTQQGRFVDTTDEQFDRMWATNIGAVVSLSRLVINHWRAAGTAGVLLMMCSPGGERAHANQGLYDVTKGAVAALVRVLAVECGPDGIRTCGISPGSVSSLDVHPEPGLPLRRTVSPDEVADTAVWLASDRAAAITGVIIPVDGGLLAQLRTPTTP